MKQEQIMAPSYDISKVQVLEAEQNISEADKEAISQIRNWVYGICINKAKIEEIHVSPMRYQAGCGTCKDKTLIYLCANKEEAPIIQVNKSLQEVTLEDILSNLTVINNCICSQ